MFFTFATWIHVPTRQGAELRGENAGFSTFFSTVVENFGGRPYGGAAGDVTLAHARNADNPLQFSWRVPNDAQGLTPPGALRYYQRFSATCFWRQGIRDHETYVPAKPSSPPSHTRLPGAHEHEERSARPEASPSQGPETADGFVASLIESGRTHRRHRPGGDNAVPAFQQRPPGSPACRVPASLFRRNSLARPLRHARHCSEPKR